MSPEERAERILTKLSTVGDLRGSPRAEGDDGRAHPFGCSPPRLMECERHKTIAISWLADEIRQAERDAQDVATAATRKRGSL